MSAGPDGPEQRIADAEERSWTEDEEFDRLEDQAESDLMDLAAIRINELSEESL